MDKDQLFVSIVRIRSTVVNLQFCPLKLTDTVLSVQPRYDEAEGCYAQQAAFLSFPMLLYQ